MLLAAGESKYSGACSGKNMLILADGTIVFRGLMMRLTIDGIDVLNNTSNERCPKCDTQ